jgi:hypothetical protein
MNSTNLPGLTPIALLALSTTLIGLISIGLPLTFAAEPPKLTDWLGFAGNLISGMITLGAAFAAWVAVQSQLAEQRAISDRQSAIQSYGVLHDLASVLENEIRLSLKLNQIARSTTIIDELRQAQPISPLAATTIAPMLENARKDLVATTAEWEIADTKRWQFQSAHEERMAFEQSIVELTGLLTRHIATLDIALRRPGGTKDPQKLIDGVTFSSSANDVHQRRQAYTTKINSEIARLLPKLARLRKEGDL